MIEKGVWGIRQRPDNRRDGIHRWRANSLPFLSTYSISHFIFIYTHTYIYISLKFDVLKLFLVIPFHVLFCWFIEILCVQLAKLSMLEIRFQIVLVCLQYEGMVQVWLCIFLVEWVIRLRFLVLFQHRHKEWDLVWFCVWRPKHCIENCFRDLRPNIGPTFYFSVELMNYGCMTLLFQPESGWIVLLLSLFDESNVIYLDLGWGD